MAEMTVLLIDSQFQVRPRLKSILSSKQLSVTIVSARPGTDTPSQHRVMIFVTAATGESHDPTCRTLPATGRTEREHNYVTTNVCAVPPSSTLCTVDGLLKKVS